MIGMAGVLPYLATSISTFYLAFDINHANETGSGFLVSPHTAELLLHIIEPLQVGYGAVVSSYISQTLIIFAVLISTDLVILRCYPLGPRVGQIRRRPRLPTIRLWSRRSSSRMANHPVTHRIRSHLPILRLHLPVLRRRERRGQRMGPSLVLDIQIRLDFRGGREYRPQLDRQRSNCRPDQQAP